MLTFKPEPSHVLHARYPEAIRPVFDTESIQLGSAKRPGECRANVFDCEDGLRLIISRDDMGHAEPTLHFSASIQEDTKLWRQLKAGLLTPERFVHIAEWRFVSISCEHGVRKLVGFSAKGIPHFVVDPAFNLRLQEKASV